MHDMFLKENYCLVHTLFAYKDAFKHLSSRIMTIVTAKLIMLKGVVLRLLYIPKLLYFLREAKGNQAEINKNY